MYRLRDIPSFVVNGSSGRQYRIFIKSVRRKWGKIFRGNVRSLPKVGDDRVYPLRLVGTKGDLILFFRQRDLYSIAWGKEIIEKASKPGEKKEDLKVYIFTDALNTLKKINKLVQEKKREKSSDPFFDILLKANDAKIQSDYGTLRHLVGGDFTKIELGREALLSAVDELIEMKSRYEVGNFRKQQEKVAEACWVIIQMIPESLRFEKLLQLLVSKYKNKKGVQIDADIEEMELNWRTTTTNLEKLWFHPGKLSETEKQMCENLRLVMADKVENIDTFLKK